MSVSDLVLLSAKTVTRVAGVPLVAQVVLMVRSIVVAEESLKICREISWPELLKVIRERFAVGVSASFGVMIVVVKLAVFRMKFQVAVLVPSLTTRFMFTVDPSAQLMPSFAPR